MNALSDLGVIIVTDRQAHVHVSGHPGRPELGADVRLDPARRSSCRCTASLATWPSRRASPWRTAFRRRSSSRTATSSALRRTGRRSWTRCASGGSCSTATSSFRPTARRSPRRRRLGYNGLISVALPVGADGELAGSTDDPAIRRAGRRGSRRFHRRRDRFRRPGLQSDRWRKISFVRPSGLRSAAARRPGPARSRSSTSCSCRIGT